MSARDQDRLLDWRRVGRRLLRVLLAVCAVAILGIAVTWGLTGRMSRTAAGLWVGVAALLLVVGAVLVVTVSAFRGMLRAGERGERLGGGDVGLLPPQAVRSGHEDRGTGGDR